MTQTRLKETPQPLNRLRLAALIAPPVALILLWTRPGFRPRQRLLGTLGILAYSILYAAAILWILVRTAILEVEWRGGFPPVLTFARTAPDYEALERHRAQQQRGQPGDATAASYQGSFWNQFRGPARDGHYTERPVLTHWPPGGPRLLWRQPAGGGYASFVFGQGLAFTIEQRRTEEAVAAYNIDTGAEVWTHRYGALFQEAMGGDGPRATPAYDEGRVYSLGALGDLVCLDAATGELEWRRNILSDHGAANLPWAMSASPLVADDKIIVLPGGPNNGAVAAYDKRSGEPVWGNLNDPAAYASPMLVELAGRRQILVVTARRAAGLAVEDGSLLWEYPWTVPNDNHIAQPVILGPSRFLLSAGYNTGSAAVEVTGASGGFQARTVWQNRQLKNKFSSSVYWQGHVYGLDESILTCLDAGTGERKWKDGRYGYGQLLLASGHLIILSGEGELALVRASPARHEELARVPFFRGKTWNHPAMADGRLFVRNAAEMACFDLRIGAGNESPSRVVQNP